MLSISSYTKKTPSSSTFLADEALADSCRLGELEVAFCDLKKRKRKFETEIESMGEKKSILPDELVMNKIHMVRGQKVMLDRDLTELYDVKAIRL